MTPALLLLAALGAARREPAGPTADRPDKLIVPEAARLEKVWGEGSFTEGPAYGPDGCIYFSDIGNRVMKFDPASGKATEYRNPSGRANGLDFDPQGRLVAAEGAGTRGSCIASSSPPPPAGRAIRCRKSRT